MSTAPGTIEVQIFGTKKSADTRKALRFFAERRVRTHFVDMDERAPSPGELSRFASRFGVASLVDKEARRFRDLGLASARLSDERWEQLLLAEPCLIRMPLARCGQKLSVGLAEDEWRGWVAR